MYIHARPEAGISHYVSRNIPNLLKGRQQPRFTTKYTAPKQQRNLGPDPSKHTETAKKKYNQA
jgi:hypothetical protein